MSAMPPSSPAAIEPWEVLDLLTSLIQKSQVVYEEDEQGHGRYRLLEPMRQYARDRLLEATDEVGGREAAEVRDRHLKFFLQWAEQRQGLEGCLDENERERDNLRAALGWSEAQANAEAGLRLGTALWWFWEQRGYAREGREHLATVLALPGAGARTPARAHALHGAGRLAQVPGDWQAARALMEECLVICREIGDREHTSWVLNDLGRVLTEQGEYEPARALLEESLELGNLGSLGNLGLLALYQGNYGAAQMLLEECLAGARDAGKVSIAWTLNCLGRVAFEQEEYGPARALLEEALTNAREVGYKPGIGDALGHMGLAALYQGDVEAAMALLEESLALFRELGERGGAAWTLCGLGSVACRQGEYGAARALHEESLALYREVGNKPGIVKNLEGLAAVAVAQGHFERTACLLGAVEGLREAIGVRLPPAERHEHERCVIAARTALGQEAFAAAWAAGRAMTMDQAIRYALERETRPHSFN